MIWLVLVGCGKYFRVCTLSITDPGDSDIIRTMPEPSQKEPKHKM